MIIDENLSWNDDTHHIVKKANSSLYMLKKAKPYIPFHSLMMLYNGIVSPHFDYCDTIWGTCNETTSQKVQRLQNRAAKIISGMARYDSSTEALNILNRKNLKERQTSHRAITMFKTMNGQAPKYLADRFNLKVSNYNLRSYKHVSIPKPKTDFLQKKVNFVLGCYNMEFPTKHIKRCVQFS